MDSAISFPQIILMGGWIVIYPVDSTIQRLNNWGLVDSIIHLLNSWGQVLGGHLGIFWVGMCHPELQIGIPFYKKIPLKYIPRSRNGPIFLYPVLEFALKLIPLSRNGLFFHTPF